MINWPLVFTIAAPLLLLIAGALVNRYFERRPRLLAYYGHIAAFKLNNDERTDVFSHSVILRNAGNTAALNVVLGHNVLPNIYIFPSIQHSARPVPDAGQEIHFPIIPPKESITISYLYYPPHTYRDINTYIRSDWGLAKVIEVILQPRPPKWILTIIWILVGVGLITLIYLLLIAGSYIYGHMGIAK